MTEQKSFNVKKVAVVSHDYNITNIHGHQDFAEHFSQINKVCDSKGCNTILYSLFTWDEQSPVPRNHQSVFEGLKNIECVFVEVGNKKSAGKVMEVWLKDEEKPRLLEQKFAKSIEPYEQKREFARDIYKRRIGNGILVICGESNIANFSSKEKNFRDDFGFNDTLKSYGTQFVFNPLHDYMTRHEMKKKRGYYSKDKRAVITVWNQGKRKGEAAIPWTLFYNGEDLTGKVQELSRQIATRPDIRIGIVPDIF